MRSTDGVLSLVLAALALVLGGSWVLTQGEEADRKARGEALATLIDRVTGPKGFDYSGPVPLCRTGDFDTCVIDGDSVLFRGEQLRLERIDAPEIADAQCENEEILALQARDRLSVALSNTPFRVVRYEDDRYGRTLARLRTEDGWISSVLVDEGLAHWWDTGRGWC
ncbi:MAG: thermonuclease family protein [Pseudomonadota bacterium]